MPQLLRRRSCLVALSLPLLGAAASCVPITADCGGPWVREAFSVATVRDAGDTLSAGVSAYEYESRGGDGTDTHQINIEVTGTYEIYDDTVPTTLRSHVIGARIETISGVGLYGGAFPTTSSHLNGAGTLGLLFTSEMDGALFNAIRNDLLANNVVFVIETDGAVQFAPMPLVLKDGYDWKKTSGCQ